jgi:hypothetical protein
MWWMNRGVTDEPSLSNAAYAVTRSSGRTADDPIALDGNGAIGVLIPSSCASAAIVSMPSVMPISTATGLRERVSASRRVMGPRNCPSSFFGRYTPLRSTGMASAVSYTIELAVNVSASAVE